MNEQVKGALLAAIAALLGWLSITSVGLLVQMASLQVTVATQKELLTENSGRDHKAEERILEELRALRTLIEDQSGRK